MGRNGIKFVKWVWKISELRIRIQVGSGFNWVYGSGSGFLANKVGNEEISFIFERGGCSLKVLHEGLRPQLPVLPHMVKI